MHNVVCLLSLGTDAYLEGGLARIRAWAHSEGCSISFIALDSLEVINEKILGRQTRSVQHYCELLKHVFSSSEYDLYLSSDLENSESYRAHLATIAGIVQSNRSIRNLCYSQTYRSLHRQLATIGIKNQRHAIVGTLSEYLVREFGLLTYLATEFNVQKEVSLHRVTEFRQRVRSALPGAVKLPDYVLLDQGVGVSDLSLENLVVPIGDGSRSVGPLNVLVRAGTILGVVGPNGVGKSTLLKVIAGHVVPSSGTVTLAGKDITKASPLERKVATVFQDSALFPSKTLQDNIAIGARLSSRRGKPQLSEEFGPYLLLFELQGKEGVRASRLSGGEQQLGAIARALSARPSILLLDEPGASVDQIRRRKAIATIREFVQQVATACVLVTHDPELLFSICDELLVLSADGKQLASGKASSFLDGGGSITAAELVGLPNLFRCKLAETATVQVPDLGVVIHSPQSARQPRGVYIPPSALRVVDSALKSTPAGQAMIRGRLQYRAAVPQGEAILVRIPTGKVRGALPSRSVLLIVSGSSANVSTSNEIALVFDEQAVRFLGE